MLTKEQKEQVIKDLKERISRMKSLVLVDYTGMKVSQMADLRKQLKESDSELKVAKKRLVDIALKENKLEMNLGQMKGQVALAFGYKDEVSPAKTVNKVAEETKILKIIAGIAGGNYLDETAVKALAKLPSREELLAKFVGTIAAPVSGFVNVLQGNIRGLVTVLSKINK